MEGYTNKVLTGVIMNTKYMKYKKFSGLLIASALFVSFFASNSFAQSVNKTLGYFEGALQVQVTGPKSPAAGTNKDNTFTLQINDGNGTPYPAITKEFVSASVQMTNMDMGITPVKNINAVLDANKQYQGTLTMNPVFSMKGPWKLTIKITVSDADGNPMTDTQSVTFDVNK